MTKSQHGGPRPGAGRPPLSDHKKRVRCGHITLQRWVLDWLAGMKRPAGHIIEEALIEKYNLEEPE